MSNNRSFTESLKRTKESIGELKDILYMQFPDDVTTSGNPDLIHASDENGSGSCNQEADDEKTKNR
jgi:hypothetical protein